ncbi:MAG: hypothetical protein V1856_00785 [Candidatus Liptonbacteria bacterium]
MIQVGISAKKSIRSNGEIGKMRGFWYIHYFSFLDNPGSEIRKM